MLSGFFRRIFGFNKPKPDLLSLDAEFTAKLEAEFAAELELKAIRLDEVQEDFEPEPPRLEQLNVRVKKVNSVPWAWVPWGNKVENVDPTAKLKKHQQFLLSLLFDHSKPGRIKQGVYRIKVTKAGKTTKHFIRLTRPVIKRPSESAKKRAAASHRDLTHDDYRYDVREENLRGFGGFGKLHLIIRTLKSMSRQVLPDNKKNPGERINKKQRSSGPIERQNVDKEAENAREAGVRIKSPVGDERDTYITMETIKGKELFEIIQDDISGENKLTLEQRFNISIQITLALQAILDQGVIHRDIKPENIMIYLLPGTDEIRIIDFGASRKSIDIPDEQLVGSPSYAAPEMVADPKSAVETADTYSLMATLRRLWQLETTEDRLRGPANRRRLLSSRKERKEIEFTNEPKWAQDVYNSHIEEIRDIPEEIKNLLKAMGKFDPEERPALMKVVKKFELLKLNFKYVGNPNQQLKTDLLQAQSARKDWRGTFFDKTIPALKDILETHLAQVSDSSASIQLFIETFNVPFFVGCNKKEDMLLKLNCLEDKKNNLLTELTEKKALLIDIINARRALSSSRQTIGLYNLLKEIKIDVEKAEACGNSFVGIATACEKLERRNQIIEDKLKSKYVKYYFDLILSRKVETEDTNKNELGERVRFAISKHIRTVTKTSSFFRQARSLTNKEKEDIKHIIEIINGNMNGEDLINNIQDILNQVGKGFFHRNPLVDDIQSALKGYKENLSRQEVDECTNTTGHSNTC